MKILSRHIILKTLLANLELHHFLRHQMVVVENQTATKYWMSLGVASIKKYYLCTEHHVLDDCQSLAVKVCAYLISKSYRRHIELISMSYRCHIELYLKEGNHVNAL